MSIWSITIVRLSKFVKVCFLNVKPDVLAQNLGWLGSVISWEKTKSNIEKYMAI